MNKEFKEQRSEEAREQRFQRTSKKKEHNKEGRD